MSKKSSQITKLLEKIETGSPLPAPLEGASLLEQGLHAVLLRRLPAPAAAEALAKLRTAYPDWNELRVAQSQEISGILQLGPVGLEVAADARNFLQEIFQESHGLSLEFLADDQQAAARFADQLKFTGMGTAHYLMWLADGRELPISNAMVRVLDRLGLVARSGSVKKSRAAIAPLVPRESWLDFSWRIGEIASRWCDARKPACHICVLVDDCKHGKKTYKEWKVQQERMEVQRQREEARQAVLQKKEEQRRLREEARARKLAEIAARKAAIVAERQARIDARKREALELKAAQQRAKARAAEEAKKLAARKAEEARKLAARKAAEEAKKLALRKALEAKKAAAQKKRVEEARKAAAKKAAAKAAAKVRPQPRRAPAAKAAKKSARKPARR